MALLERFWAKVQKCPTGCWEWQGAHGPAGHGRFYYNGRTQPAHQYSYEFHKGPVPQGLELDHLCRNPRCVNPEHLEAVSHKENMHRAPKVVAMMAATQCPKGHPYNLLNTYFHPNGGRVCRECRNERKNARYAEKVGRPVRSPFQPACINGHPFTKDNTVWELNRHGKLYRRCLICKKAKDARYRATDKGKATKAKNRGRPRGHA